MNYFGMTASNVSMIWDIQNYNHLNRLNLDLNLEQFPAGMSKWL